MGIVNALINLGIRLESAAQTVSTSSGAMPLQWPAGIGDSLIYRLPRDPHQRASLFAASQTIVVMDGETAIVFQDGKVQGALEAGRYVFEKKRVVGLLDVIWMKVGQRPMRWGIGNVSSLDGISIGANGVIYLRVADPVSFNSEIIQGAVTLSEADLQRLLLPRIQGVFRPVLAENSAAQLQRERDKFCETVKTKLVEVLLALGVELVDFEVTEINFPPEFKDALARATISQHVGAAAMIEAQAKSQITIMKANAEAHSQLVLGAAEAGKMKQLLDIGINPVQMAMLEVAKTLAENPAQGVLNDVRPQLIAPILGAAANVHQLTQQSLQSTTPAAQLPPTSHSAQPAQNRDTAGEIQELERQLDSLVQRLVDGAISEATFEKLSARLETKIAELKLGASPPSG